MTDIRHIISRRSDLSTFVVHLTRDMNGGTARDALLAILRQGKIEARSPYGHAVSKLREANISLDSQKCVCFTETPLEHLHLLTQPIDGRDFQFKSYGIAITRVVARRCKANPVWYLDMTPRTPFAPWLTSDVDDLVQRAVDSGSFDTDPISRLAPFIEQMGHQPERYCKEFWWEREWRVNGDFDLPDRFLVLCPESDFATVQEPLGERSPLPAFVDPSWGLEQIIGRLAGFGKIDIDVY